MEWDKSCSVNVVLPKLPEEGSHKAALCCGDWVAEITPLVHDVSSHAGPWWTQLMQHVGQVYKKWLASDSLTRLLFTVDIEVKHNALWLESRMASMRLAALPASLKAEVIAARKLTAGAIMLEVLKRFQPLSEKSALRTCRRRGQCGRCGPGTGTSSQMWSGASELAVTLPDPVVLQIYAFAVVKGALT